MSKRIGIIGGMTPESTRIYYEHIIRKYQQQYRDFSFPEIIIYSVSFQKYLDWMISGDWHSITQELIRVVKRIGDGGADFGIIATNTMHKVFPEIVSSSDIPLISIIDATAEEILKRNFKRVGLIGTRFTMKDGFYGDRLSHFSITTIIPDDDDIKIVDEIIFNELSRGVVREESRSKYVKIVHGLHHRGADAVVMGCTEIPMLINEQLCGIPLLDTTRIHAEKALRFALGDK